jgi:hypothetical protein
MTHVVSKADGQDTGAARVTDDQAATDRSA